MPMLEGSERSVDLRIAIADGVGFDYRDRVRGSNSNSLAAIHFRREQFDQIAAALGVDDTGQYNKHGLVNAIRAELGRENRRSGNLDWAELRDIVEQLAIPVETPYEWGEDEDNQEEHTGTVDGGGLWSDWSERRGDRA